MDLPPMLKNNKTIFLDRDGVINKKRENDYVKNWSEFQFLPRVIDALKILTKNNFDLYIVTNQRGIARGLMSENDLAIIHERMQRELATHGVVINGIYYCPHNQDDGCNCRKPKPGLLLRAAREHEINLKEAVFVGDSLSDLETGESSGCKTIILNSKKDLLEAVEKEILPMYL